MAKRRIHRRNLIIFIVVLGALALGGAVLWLYLSNVEVRVQGYLETARQRKETGLLDEAVIECKKAIRLDKDNLEALLLLGGLHEELNAPGEALGAYQRALQLDPDALKEVLLPLAELQDRLRRYSELKGTADSILKLAPDEPLGHVYRAHYLLSLRDPAAAAESLEKAQRLDPERVETVTELVDVYMMMKDSAAAKRLLSQAGKTFGRQARFVVREAQLSELARRPGEALDLYRAAGEMEDADYGIKLESGIACERLGAVDEARRALGGLVVQHPGNNAGRIALGDLEMRQGNADAAVEALEAVDERDAVFFPEALVRLAEIDLGRLEYDAAREKLDKLDQVAPGSVSGKFVRGRLLLGEGEAAAAQELFEGVIARSPSHALARYMLAMACLQRRQTGKALAQFKEIGDLLDSRPSLVQGMVISLVSLAEYDLAIDRSRSVLLRGANPAVRLLLGLALMGKGEVDEAERQFEMIKGIPEFRARALTGLASAALQRGREAEARSILDQVVEIDRDNLDVLILQAELMYGDGDAAGARKAFEELLERFEGDLKVRLHYARLFGADPQTRAAQELSAFADDPGTTPGQLRTIAVFHRSQGRIDEAVRTAECALERGPKDVHSIGLVFDLYVLSDATDRVRGLLESLGRSEEIDAFKELAFVRLSILEGRYELARSELASYLKKHPDDVEARHLLGLANLRQGRTDEARRIFDRIIEEHPRRFATQALLARAYEADGEWRRAAALAGEILKRAPADDRLVALLARSNVALGQYEEALDAYRRLYELRPTAPTYRAGLARMLLALDRAEEAEELLVGWRKGDSSDTAVLALLADARLAQDDDEGALSLVEGAYGNSDHDPWIGLMLAGLHHRLGDGEGADEVLGEVVSRSPEQLDVLLAATRLCLSSGRSRLAFELAGRAYEKDRDTLATAVQYAQAALAAGNLDVAGEVLDDLGLRYPSNAGVALYVGRLRMAQRRPEEATDFFAKAARLDPTSALAHYEMARSYLARADAVAAEAALSRAIVLNPAFGPAKALQIDVLRTNDKVDEAIVLAQDLLKQSPGEEAVHQRLCEMLVDRGRVEAAREALDEVRARFEEADWPYQTLARLYRDGGRYDEAVAELAEGVAAHPDSLVLAGALSVTLVEAGRPEEAVERARAFVEGREGALSAQLVLASVLERAGSFKAAEDAFASIAEAFPGEPAAYAQLGAFYDRRGDLDKAVETCERGLARHPESVQLLLSLAQVHGTRGDAHAANEAYRRVLSVDPDNILAANNLAWNLAQDETTLVEALELARRASERAPTNAFILDTLGYAHLARGEAAEAERIFRKVVRLERGRPVFYYHLARALEARGALAEAIENLETALSLQAEWASREEARKLLERLRTRAQQ